MLIGKSLSEMRVLCNSDTVDVYICNELIEEFTRIASQEKIKKYASDERVIQTLKLMQSSCNYHPVTKSAKSPNLRDMKDLYLLSFAETINADFLITGDKGLLSLQSHHQTKIITYNEIRDLIKE
jgi:putative PIN family toxin of toxin-antitoxin system